VIVVKESRVYDPAAEINRITLFRVLQGGAEEPVGELKLRSFGSVPAGVTVAATSAAFADLNECVNGMRLFV